MRAKTNRHQSNKKRNIFIGMGIGIIALCAVLLYIALRPDSNQHASEQSHTANDRPVNSVDYSPSSPDDNNANEDRKNDPSGAGQTLNPGQPGNQDSEPSVTVTRAGVINGNLQVGTLIGGATSGSCTITVSQAGQTSIVQTVNIQKENNTYACPVFNIPSSQFPNQGKWNVSVSVTYNGKTATGNWQANPVSLAGN